MKRSVGFRQMKDGTREDYLLLEEYEQGFIATQPERILEALRALDHSLDGYPVTRLGHSLQAATRAERDGADEDMVVGVLLHDVGDLLAPFNHSEVAAAILRPYVREQVTWIVANHGLFQAYYYAHHFGKNRNARERLRDHPWYSATVDFCERWDQSSFDPGYDTLPLSHFEPLVRRVFSRKAHDPLHLGAQPA
jgi:predicted HD phosphohydrolase